MKDRPILFSAPMVRAILDGTKTQTRRVLKTQPPFLARIRHAWFDAPVYGFTDEDVPAAKWWKIKCPYGQPRQRLWVRETIELRTLTGNSYPSPVYSADGAHVMDGDRRASNHEFMRRRVRPSIHMPRWASRITLEIVSVRVERLQDISEEGATNDCTVEGVFHAGLSVPSYDEAVSAGFKSVEKLMFQYLWESINGAGSWAANPWVWVIEFKNISQKVVAKDCDG